MGAKDEEMGVLVECRLQWELRMRKMGVLVECRLQCDQRIRQWGISKM